MQKRLYLLVYETRPAMGANVNSWRKIFAEGSEDALEQAKAHLALGLDSVRFACLVNGPDMLTLPVKIWQRKAAMQ
jgi:hypothetical protein